MMDRNEEWTEKMVITRFEEAARTMRRLPPVKAQGYVSIWPEILHSEMEKIQMDKKPRKWPAMPEDITKMEEACDWLLLLEEIDERRLVWLRAERIPWKPICWRLGVSRATANRRWKNALRIITQKLNEARMYPKG